MSGESDWSSRLKWAEESGLKSLQEKFTTADNINKEAQTTLTYVLAGMGGTFAYILPGLAKPIDTLLFGSVALCLYFAALGFYLTRKTFFLGTFPAPYQEAENLLDAPERPLDEVRYGEILNMSVRLAKSNEWIANKAIAINRVRFALLLSPISFVLGCLGFKYI